MGVSKHLWLVGTLLAGLAAADQYKGNQDYSSTATASTSSGLTGMSVYPCPNGQCGDLSSPECSYTRDATTGDFASDAGLLDGNTSKAIGTGACTCATGALNTVHLKKSEHKCMDRAFKVQTNEMVDTGAIDVYCSNPGDQSGRWGGPQLTFGFSPDGANWLTARVDQYIKQYSFPLTFDKELRDRLLNDKGSQGVELRWQHFYIASGYADWELYEISSRQEAAGRPFESFTILEQYRDEGCSAAKAYSYKTYISQKHDCTMHLTFGKKACRQFASHQDRRACRESIGSIKAVGGSLQMYADSMCTTTARAVWTLGQPGTCIGLGYGVWGKVLQHTAPLPDKNVVLVRFQGRPSPEHVCDRDAPHYFEEHQWGECIQITSSSSIRFYQDDPTGRAAFVRAYKFPDCDLGRVNNSAIYTEIAFISDEPRFHVYELPCMDKDTDKLTLVTQPAPTLWTPPTPAPTPAPTLPPRVYFRGRSSTSAGRGKAYNQDQARGACAHMEQDDARGDQYLEDTKVRDFLQKNAGAISLASFRNYEDLQRAGAAMAGAPGLISNDNTMSSRLGYKWDSADSACSTPSDRPSAACWKDINGNPLPDFGDKPVWYKSGGNSWPTPGPMVGQTWNDFLLGKHHGKPIKTMDEYVDKVGTQGYEEKNPQKFEQATCLFIRTDTKTREDYMDGLDQHGQTRSSKGVFNGGFHVSWNTPHPVRATTVLLDSWTCDGQGAKAYVCMYEADTGGALVGDKDNTNAIMRVLNAGWSLVPPGIIAEYGHYGINHHTTYGQWFDNYVGIVDRTNGWRQAQPGQTCTDACQAEGLTCDDYEFKSRIDALAGNDALLQIYPSASMVVQEGQSYVKARSPCDRCFGLPPMLWPDDRKDTYIRVRVGNTHTYSNTDGLNAMNDILTLSGIGAEIGAEINQDGSAFSCTAGGGQAFQASPIMNLGNNKCFFKSDSNVPCTTKNDDTDKRRLCLCQY